MSHASLTGVNTITVRNTAVDDWGARTRTLIPNVKARVMFGNKIVRNFKGEEVVSVAKVFPQDKTVDINPTSEIDVDGSGKWRAVLKIAKPQDGVSIHHLEVWVA